MSEPEERLAPVQGTGSYWLPAGNPHRKPDTRSPGTITWEEHFKAWGAYTKRHSGQSAERIAERGGFGYEELIEYLGHEPKTWVTR